MQQMGRTTSRVYGRFKERFMELAGVLAALVVLCFILSRLSPIFLTSSNVITVLRQVAISSLIAFGMTAVIISGGIDLSVAGTFVLSGIVSSYLFVKVGIGLVPVILITLLVGAFIGSINGLIIAFMKLPPFIVTLGMSFITAGLAGVISDNKPIQLMNPSFNYLGVGFVGPIPILIIYMVVLFFAISYALNRTRFGKHIYAVGGNPTTARYSGINVERLQFSVYIIIGMLASATGLITAARLYSGQPTAGANAEIDAIAAVVIGGASFNGGKGSLAGTLIGAIIIRSISNGLNLLGVNTFWQKVATGVIIILAVALDALKNSNWLKGILERRRSANA